MRCSPCFKTACIFIIFTVNIGNNLDVSLIRVIRDNCLPNLWAISISFILTDRIMLVASQITHNVCVNKKPWTKLGMIFTSMLSPKVLLLIYTLGNMSLELKYSKRWCCRYKSMKLRQYYFCCSQISLKCSRKSEWTENFSLNLFELKKYNNKKFKQKKKRSSKKIIIVYFWREYS